MYNVVRGYVTGQVIVALLGAFFSFIMLTIASTVIKADVNALALAALVFVFGLIPTIGSYINALVITLVSLFSSPTLAIIMLIYYVVYQQIENATIQPYVQSKTNELTPLTIFIAALLGLGFGGILGGLVAIPLAGCGKILLEDWLDDGEYNASTFDSKKN
jgi:predicted PurR-regulated permease PerM